MNQVNIIYNLCHTHLDVQWWGLFAPYPYSGEYGCIAAN